MLLEDALKNIAKNPIKEDPTWATCIVASFSDFFFSQFIELCFITAAQKPDERYFTMPQGEIKYIFWHGQIFELHYKTRELFYRPDLDKFWITE